MVINTSKGQFKDLFDVRVLAKPPFQKFEVLANSDITLSENPVDLIMGFVLFLLIKLFYLINIFPIKRKFNIVLNKLLSF